MKHDIRCKGTKTDQELFESWKAFRKPCDHLHWCACRIFAKDYERFAEQIEKGLGTKLTDMRLKELEEQQREITKKLEKRKWFQFSQ